MERHRKKHIWCYSGDARIVPAKIVSTPEVIEYSETSVKTIFDCESTSGIPQKCIHWGRVNISKGDEVQLIGRFKNEVFIAWGVMITAKNKELPNGTNT